jgi:ribose 5-phosphate isomerase A
VLEKSDQQQGAKQAAAEAALAYVQDGMYLGLGSGSTAEFFIHKLGRVHQEKHLDIHCLATSKKSEQLAQSYGLPLLSEETTSYLDLVVDGADQIDREKNLIKGLGGALFREKIVATMGKKVVIIADETKKVAFLGKNVLPLEISPFGAAATISSLEKMGFSGKIRCDSEGKNYKTDQNNYIYDLALPYFCHDPQKMDHLLKQIPGLIETGFFLDVADLILIGKQNGQVEIIT